MSFYRKLIEFSQAFPEMEALPGLLPQRTFAKLGYGNAKSYVMFSVAASVIFGVIFAAAFFAMGINFAPIIALGTLFFSLFILLRIPDLELKRKASVMDAELPLMLREIGMLLDMKVPFARAVKIASQKDSELAAELSLVAKETDSGMAMQKALSKLATRVDSMVFGRAVAQLIFAFELGERGREISRIGDDMLLIQQHRIRDFGSKSAIFGLLFLVSTAVLPTFFLIYTFLSGAVFKTEISETGITFALLIAFPAVSFGIISISKLSLPPTMFKGEENGGTGAVSLVLAAFAAGAILFLGKPLVYAVFPLLIATLGIFFYPRYKKDRVKEEIEKYLPDALFALSGLPKGSRAEAMFELIKNSGYGELSRQAGITVRQMKANVKPEAAIEDFAKRSSSDITKRACDMLIHAINTNAFESLNAIADDVLKFFEIERERERTLAMQKYTILFGGFVIPLIIKIALSLLKTTEKFSGGSGAGIEFLSLVVPVYLIMYSMLAGSYASEVEGRKSRSAFYFIIISCSSLAIFYFVNF